jgi:hypothetical protein
VNADSSPARRLEASASASAWALDVAAEDPARYGGDARLVRLLGRALAESPGDLVHQAGGLARVGHDGFLSSR